MESAIVTQKLNRETAYFEHVTIPLGQSFLWRMDDYPRRRNVWNYHPEFEIHLIRHSSGLAHVGDHIGGFDAGQLILVGSNLPHNWITPFTGDQTLPDRDIVVQFDADRLRHAAAAFPELADLNDLFERAAFGLEFSGDAAVKCAAGLEQMGKTSGLSALSLLLTVLADLASAKEYRKLASQQFVDQFRPGSENEQARLQRALDHIQKTFLNGPACADIAAHIGMSESAFSRFFKAYTGNTYTDHVISLRIWTARKMLVETETPITDVCYEAGFNNISNFNRTFLRAAGMSPLQYRKAMRERSIP